MTPAGRTVLQRGLVRDVMTTDVVSVSPGTPLDGVARTLLDRSIRAVPVLDGGTVLGVVSEADLLRTAEELAPRRRGERSRPDRDTDVDPPVTAADVMTAPAVCIRSDESIAQAARTMRSHRVGWLPVLDAAGDRVVGVLGRADLLAVFLRTDNDLHTEIVDEVFGHFLRAEPDAVDVGVRDGVVTLRGWLARRSDAELAVALVSRLEGVVSVIDELTSGSAATPTSEAARAAATTDRDDAQAGAVVVGVDASASAGAAARWAADLAAARGSGLRLVHAVRPEDGRDSLTADVLRRLCTEAESVGVRDVRTAMVPGTPAEVLVAQSCDAGLLVLGSAGTRFGPGLTGPLARLLADGVACPLAVVRGATPQLPPPRQGPVVVGVDGSEPARAAVATAAGLAAGWAAPLVLVHAWNELTTGGDGDLHLGSDHWAEREAAARLLLDEEVARVRALRPGLAVGTELTEDTALATLLHHARDARTVVVGHRDRVISGTTEASVLQGLIAFAPCPVVRVR